MIEPLRDAELSRLFADWSTPVIVRRIDQGLDSDFDDVSENATDFEVEAVVRPLKTSAEARTAMQHAVTQCDFLLRTSELPDGLPLTACRIVATGREWSVIQVTRSADGQTVEVRGQTT